MYLTLSIWCFFILFVQPINGAQFLNTSLLLLFGSSPSCDSIILIPFTSIYASL